MNDKIESLNERYPGILYLLLIAIIILGLITIVKAQNNIITYGKFERFTNITFYQDCDCTYVNITGIEYKGKNATSLTFPLSMTRSGSHFTKGITGLNEIGENYVITGIGDPQGVRTPWKASFDIVQQRSQLYIDFKDTLTIVIIAGFVIIILCMIFWRLFFIAGIILLITGFILLTNGFNFLLSMLLILGGLFFSITKS